MEIFNMVKYIIFEWYFMLNFNMIIYVKLFEWNMWNFILYLKDFPANEAELIRWVLDGITPGATKPLGLCFWVWKVSIHAPARGATNDSNSKLYGYKVSIHAPARGATKRLRTIELLLGFNPRPRTGGDNTIFQRTFTGLSFNPRPRTGGDPPSIFLPLWAVGFQSTPPHGGRRALRSRGWLA